MGSGKPVREAWLVQTIAPGLPEGVMTHPRLPLNVRAVLQGLLLYMQVNRSKKFPSVESLADYLNAPVGEVDSSLRTLRDRGFLGRENGELHVARWKEKQLRVDFGEPEAPSEKSPPLPKGKIKPPPVRANAPNATTVRQWILADAEKYVQKGLVFPRWGAKQNKLAKMLLDDLGPEMVRAGVQYMCEHWISFFVEKRNVEGLPSIEFLWGWRDAIFGRVQLRLEKKQGAKRTAADFSSDDKGPEEGF